MHNPVLLDHFENPRHFGDLTDPDAVGTARYNRCGDRLRMTFRLVDGSITAVGFVASGCGPVKAAGSLAAEYLHGRPVGEARNLSAFVLDGLLGGLPASKRHALWMVLECLHEALGPRDLATDNPENQHSSKENQHAS